MEADRPEPGALEERREVTVGQVGGIDDRASLRSEDEPARLVEGAHLLHLFQLAGEVRSQGRHRASREPDSAAALVRLRLVSAFFLALDCLYFREHIFFHRLGEAERQYTSSTPVQVGTGKFTCVRLARKRLSYADSWTLANICEPSDLPSHGRGRWFDRASLTLKRAILQVKR